MNTILHMPHTSLEVPEEFYEGLLIPKLDFNLYNLLMSDVLVDELFKDFKGIKIMPKYSRLFCDVERFRNDEDEVMSKIGQGVIYTHTFDGICFHKHDSKYMEFVLDYYDKYHKNLDDITTSLLKTDNRLLILDIHSFSDRMASSIMSGPFPDVCIGIEKDYYDEKLVNKLINSIKDKGYTYRINYPYKGSLVPNCVMNKKVKGNVVSIMIEINKRIYLG